MSVFLSSFQHARLTTCGYWYEKWLIVSRPLLSVSCKVALSTDVQGARSGLYSHSASSTSLNKLTNVKYHTRVVPRTLDLHWGWRTLGLINVALFSKRRQPHCPSGRSPDGAACSVSLPAEKARRIPQAKEKTHPVLLNLRMANPRAPGGGSRLVICRMAVSSSWKGRA